MDLEAEEFLTKEMDQVIKVDILHQKVILEDLTKVDHVVVQVAEELVKPVL